MQTWSVDCLNHAHKRVTHMPRVPTPPGKSWIFFLKIPGPGKSWKLKLKVLESPGKISLRITHSLLVLMKTSRNSKFPVCVDLYLLKWLINFAAFGFPYTANPGICRVVYYSL